MHHVKFWGRWKGANASQTKDCVAALSIIISNVFVSLLRQVLQPLDQDVLLIKMTFNLLKLLAVTAIWILILRIVKQILK